MNQPALKTESFKSRDSLENTKGIFFSAIWGFASLAGLIFTLSTLFSGKLYIEWGNAELINGQKVYTTFQVPIIFNFLILGVMFFVAWNVLSASTSQIWINQNSIYCENFLGNKTHEFSTLKKIQMASLFDRTAFTLCFTTDKLTLEPRWHGAEFCRSMLEKIQKDHPNVQINNTLRQKYNI